MKKLFLVFILIFIALFGLFFPFPQIIQRETEYLLADWEEGLEDLPQECKEKLLQRSNFLVQRGGYCSEAYLGKFWTQGTIRIDKWYQGLVKHAAAVCFCESGGWPNAHNYSARTEDDSYGLFQINFYGNLLPGRLQMLEDLGFQKDPNEMFDPAKNIQAAISIYNGGAWNPWSCAEKLGIKKIP